MNPIIDNNIVCFFDGACEPKNPGGNMGLGAVIFKEGIEYKAYSFFVRAHESNSSNVAEYGALLWLLQTLISEGLNKEPITIYGDSMLVVKQMSGQWKIKNGFYLETAMECSKLIPKFSNLKFEWLPREFNTYADDLSKYEIKKPA